MGEDTESHSQTELSSKSPVEEGEDRSEEPEWSGTPPSWPTESTDWDS